MDEQNRNLLIATGLSMAVIMVWMVLFPPELAEEPLTQDQSSQVAGEAAGSPEGAAQTTAEGATLPGTSAPAAGTPAPGEAVADAAATAPRVEIKTPNLVGSLSLLGGRFDDLSLVEYHEELDPASPLVRLLSPTGEDYAYYALYGWAPADGLPADQVPGPTTLWSVEAGDVLTPESPVTLVWDNGAGLVFRRNLSIDDRFMISIEQTVSNESTAAVTLRPYGFVARHGRPDSQPFYVLHEGVVRASDGQLQEIKYKNMDDLDADATGGLSEPVEVAHDGWIGFTDKYWMTALIPAPGSAFLSTARFNPTSQIYQTEVLFPATTVAPGESAAAASMLFAGAKEWEAIRDYQNDLGISRFLDSIDWGWFFFLTKPIFWLLHHLNALIGNMGWSIIALTLVLKALVLPLSYRSYVGMAKMKELQPEMEKLRAEAGDDRMKLQQGTMELYKKNKVNPLSGCMPVLIQIPIFFSLYKVIFVTIELRHAPWLGWIKDLSAPDPSSILNLFGLLPWGTPEVGSIFAIVSIGVLPILLGVSMWLQQKLNPAPPDPTQKMIFAWMPWIFMFMLGTFASGLVIYWISNNVITFAQQYLIMWSHGKRPDLFGNITGRNVAPAPANSNKKPRKKT